MPLYFYCALSFLVRFCASFVALLPNGAQIPALPAPSPLKPLSKDLVEARELFRAAKAAAAALDGAKRAHETRRFDESVRLCNEVRV